MSAPGASTSSTPPAGNDMAATKELATVVAAAVAAARPATPSSAQPVKLSLGFTLTLVVALISAAGAFFTLQRDVDHIGRDVVQVQATTAQIAADVKDVRERVAKMEGAQAARRQMVVPSTATAAAESGPTTESIP